MYSQHSYVHTSASSLSQSSQTNSGGWSHLPRVSSRTPGDVPSAVRNLLLSMKQLQDILKHWSVGQASETQVSDVYVQIGTDFNATVHAFAYHKIDLSDIHSIPKDLRNVLEQCLAEDPSPQILAVFMPQVRQVLYRLLRGLQARQDAWRAVGGQMPMIPFDPR
ncbi:hypothetical protein GYMLUDRAFT_48006 [Collybiopsis luxurians FD-317 M1]|uniref:Aip3p/Bud6 N-terminal domain-containing protein n=1 Tax=Collybiopsis luxurians FD-317 M1 TaxID=944289 RepID=A0A0D0CB66_9AGAR|nr:hypothetical protein GYMLUDRAFT_48006 [Collybiopsis luxurians FD-317 M1]